MISGKAFFFHLVFLLLLLLHPCFSVIVNILVVIIFVHLYLQVRAHGEDCESTSYIWSVSPVTVEGNPLNSLSGASTALLVPSLILSRLTIAVCPLWPSIIFTGLTTKKSKQCCQRKIWPHYFPPGKTTLAPCWGPYPLQNCHTCFQVLWEFSFSVPFRTASHLSTLSNSSVQQQWKKGWKS